jgi:hypothetical protein
MVLSLHAVGPLSLLLWLNNVCGVSSVTVPAEVYLGGVFAPMSTKGDALQQREHLAAFVMAINEINNRTDGLYDDILVNTTLKYSVHGGSTMQGALSNFFKFSSAFDNAGVFGIVNTLSNDNAFYVNQLATNMKIPTIVTFANNGAFYDTLSFPYTTKVNTLVTHELFGIREAICQYSGKAMMFLGLGWEDIQGLYEMQESLIYAAATKGCALTYFTSIAIRGDMSDMSSYVLQAKLSGVRYFILVTPPHQTAAIIEQGHTYAAFDENTVLFTHERGFANLTSYFTAEANVTDIMTGLFVVKYWANYNVNRTAVAKGFSQRWRQQPSTAGYYARGYWHCAQSTDDLGLRIYRSIRNNVTQCIGLDYPSYDEAGYDLQPFTAHTYDATIVMAKAVDYAIRNGLDYKDPAVLQGILVSQTNFEGASGPIRFNAGLAPFSYDGKGTRAVGIHYNITNFSPDLYRSGADNYMATVGFYDATTLTLDMCTSESPEEGCSLPRFRLKTGESFTAPPPGSPPPIYTKMTRSWQVLFLVLAGFVAVLVLVFGTLIICFRQSKVIKASQPLILGCILVGGLMAAARVVIGSLDKNQELCVAEFWTGHLAFVIMIGSLLVKAYRVHCIINTKQLRRVTFSVLDAFKILVVIVVLVSGYLVAASFYGKPYLRIDTVVASNQATITKYCGMHHAVYQYALYGFEGVLMVVTYRICWETRNVPAIVNGAGWISSAMTVIVLTSLLILPIVYFLNLPPYTNEFIAALGFVVCSSAALCLIFVPKVLGVMFKTCSDDHKHKKGPSLIDTLIAAGASDRPSLHQRKSKFIHDADDLLRNKHAAERLIICQEQLMGWQAMVLNEQGNMILGVDKSDIPANVPRRGSNRIAPDNGGDNVVVRRHSSYQAVWDQGSLVSGAEFGDNTLFTSRHGVNGSSNGRSPNAVNDSKSNDGDNGVKLFSANHQSQESDSEGPAHHRRHRGVTAPSNVLEIESTL